MTKEEKEINSRKPVIFLIEKYSVFCMYQEINEEWRGGTSEDRGIFWRFVPDYPSKVSSISKTYLAPRSRDLASCMSIYYDWSWGRGGWQEPGGTVSGNRKMLEATAQATAR
jgi:hypothetical protein